MRYSCIVRTPGAPEREAQRYRSRLNHISPLTREMSYSYGAKVQREMAPERLRPLSESRGLEDLAEDTSTKTLA